jgi:hypothetical protein
MSRIPRQVRIPISPEAVALFREGLKLLAAGRGDSDEFRDVDKKLNWSLLHRAGDLSVFDPDLDGKMPPYMARLAAGDGWAESVRLRKALLAATKG